MTALERVDPLEMTETCVGSCGSCPSVGSCGDRVVCRCLGVVEDTIISAIRYQGARTVRELKTITGAGDGCMCCRQELRHYLTVYASSNVLFSREAQTSA